jgi:hypothetical protein
MTQQKRTLADDTKFLEVEMRRQIAQTRRDIKDLNVAAYKDKSLRKSAFDSPEWQTLRKFTIWRSRGYCQACTKKVDRLDVHHSTYAYGILCPAWVLVAVCRACHQRYHSGWFGYPDPGQARQLEINFPANDNDPNEGEEAA